MTDDTTEAQILAAHEELKQALRERGDAQDKQHDAEIATYKAGERVKRANNEIERIALGREKWAPDAAQWAIPSPSAS